MSPVLSIYDVCSYHKSILACCDVEVLSRHSAKIASYIRMYM